MSAGDIWLRTNNYVGHYNALGTRINDRVIPFTELGSTFQVSNLAHDGSALWMVDGGTRVYRIDPATLAVTGTFVYTDDGDTWGLSVAVTRDAHPLILDGDSSSVGLLEVDDLGAVISSQVHGETSPPKSLIAIAPTSTVVHLFDTGYVVGRFDLATVTYDTITLVDPSGFTPSTGPTGFAPKSDGGYWVCWKTVEAPVLFVEYDNSGSTLTTVAMPQASSPYYDLFTTAVDVDASNNLVCWVNVDTDADTHSQLLKVTAGAGSVTVLNSFVTDPFAFGNSGFASNYIHVERSFTSTPPWLRQLQRDDLTRQYARNGPTSAQASIRQGPRGTYL